MSTEARKQAAAAGLPTRQCHAKAKSSGQQCTREAVPGATVCRHHGGAAPQVQRKAALRLLELVDPAISTLAREMVQADKSSDRQRAANSLLDRAGVGRKVDSPDADVAKALLVERLLALRDSRAEPEPEPPPPDVIPSTTLPEERSA